MKWLALLTALYLAFEAVAFVGTFAVLMPTRLSTRTRREYELRDGVAVLVRQEASNDAK